MELTTEQQREICAALARAMHPNCEVLNSRYGGVDVMVKLDGRPSTRWHSFDPFTDAAASRALIEWLKNDVLRLVKFTGCLWDALDISNESLEEEITEKLMTAPLAVIAAAAHAAIMEKQ